MTSASPANSRLLAAVCLALALGTLALYWPITKHPFLNYDDYGYIVENPHVNTGLSWTNVVWAFEHKYAANWHPVTWISHMLDCQMFGLKPAGHHLVNALLHAANAVLLFLFLTRTTGALGRSALVAAFFAWHPLRVESVAWAAERKDVLSAFFWMLTLLAYARHVTCDGWRVTGKETLSATTGSRFTFHASRFYWLALFCFACGLMSKPMVVTLPFVLLLLDFWPLQRLNTERIPALLIEKIPFFVLGFAVSALTFWVQGSSGAFWSLENLPPRGEAGQCPGGLSWLYFQDVLPNGPGDHLFAPASLAGHLGRRLRVAVVGVDRFDHLAGKIASVSGHRLALVFGCARAGDRPGAGGSSIHGGPLYVSARHRAAHRRGLGGK